MNEEVMTKYPPYSVLMSVYAKERPEYLRESLDSMCRQTIPPDEIVIVEDGPLTEGLLAVLNAYSAQYGRMLKRIVNVKNEGLGNALHKGVIACKNELIARMDTDDISDPNRCERQLRAFICQPNLDVIGGQINEFIDNTTNITGQRVVPCEHRDICDFLKIRDPFNHPTVMFKKSSVLRAGNYLDLHFNEDYYLWARMYLDGAKFANLDEVVLNMRISKDLYARRGGYSYYKNQKRLFKFLRNNKIISVSEYCKAKTIRFIVQVLMPNSMRAWAYKKFAR